MAERQSAQMSKITMTA